MGSGLGLGLVLGLGDQGWGIRAGAWLRSAVGRRLAGGEDAALVDEAGEGGGGGHVGRHREQPRGEERVAPRQLEHHRAKRRLRREMSGMERGGGGTHLQEVAAEAPEGVGVCFWWGRGGIRTCDETGFSEAPPTDGARSSGSGMTSGGSAPAHSGMGTFGDGRERAGSADGGPAGSAAWAVAPSCVGAWRGVGGWVRGWVGGWVGAWRGVARRGVAWRGGIYGCASGPS